MKDSDLELPDMDSLAKAAAERMNTKQADPHFPPRELYKIKIKEVETN